MSTRGWGRQRQGSQTRLLRRLWVGPGGEGSAGMWRALLLRSALVLMSGVVLCWAGVRGCYLHFFIFYLFLGVLPAWYWPPPRRCTRECGGPRGRCASTCGSQQCPRFCPCRERFAWPSTPSPVTALPAPASPDPDPRWCARMAFLWLRGLTRCLRGKPLLLGLAVRGWVTAPVLQPLVNVLQVKSFQRDARLLVSFPPRRLLLPPSCPPRLRLFVLFVQRFS